MKTVKTSSRLEKEYYIKVRNMGISIYRAFKEEININDFSDSSLSKNTQMDNFNARVEKILKISPTIAKEMNSKLYKYFLRQFGNNFANSSLKSSFNIDLRAYYGSDKKLLSQITSNSEEYIVKYGEESASWLRTEVRRNYIEGGKASSLEKDIKERFEVTDNKAKLIARNETDSFIGALNIKRGKDLGIEKGIWRTVKDERVRSSHRPLNGKVFYLNEGIEVNGEYIFPKSEINCRCYFDYIVDN